MFGPTASFWGTTLVQVIYEFGSTSATNVSSMELTPNPRRGFPYLLPSYLLGRYLNIPSSWILANSPHAPTFTRLTTPVGISQSALNPMPNSSLKIALMLSMSMPNFGNQYFPSTSYTNRRPYIPIFHNTTRPTPQVVGPSGTTGYVHVSQPPASSWVHVIPQMLSPRLMILHVTYVLLHYGLMIFYMIVEFFSFSWLI